MPDGVINFRQAKKRVKGKRKETQATENRIKFGRTKAEKQRDTDTARTLKDHVDGHKLDKPE